MRGACKGKEGCITLQKSACSGKIMQRVLQRSLLCRVMTSVQHAAQGCGGFKRSAHSAGPRGGLRDVACRSFKIGKTKMSKMAAESAASVTDGHQIGCKMRPTPVQIWGKNCKNWDKFTKHAHTVVKILAGWVQGWFLPMRVVPFGAFLGPSWEPKID